MSQSQAETMRNRQTISERQALFRRCGYDSVVSVNTFHHLERPIRVFKEMLRVLKPGGKLLLSDLSPRGFQIFHRIHRFEGGTHPHLKRRFSQQTA